MKIKMVQYGCGKMSQWTVRYALEKGIEVVAGFDIDQSKIGKDLCDGAKIYHADEFDKFLQDNEVDIVVVTTMSLFSDVYDALEICAKNGVNAITTCEEAFYPQNSNPVLFEKFFEKFRPVRNAHRPNDVLEL